MLSEKSGFGMESNDQRTFAELHRELAEKYTIYDIVIIVFARQIQHAASV